jgi:hypothetical protein
MRRIGLIQRLRPKNGKDLYFLLVAFLLPFQSVSIFRKGITTFHLMNVLILAVFLATFFLQGRRIRWYLLLPIWVYHIGSLLGMFNSQVFGLNLYTLAQDIYLYVWFVSLCLLLNSEEDVDFLTNAWVIGALIVVAAGLFLPEGGGINSRDEFTFRNPNRAASYFMTTFFLLFSPAIRGRLLFQLAAAGMLGWAVFATGSVGTFASIAVGVAVMISVYLYVRGSGFWVPRQIALVMVAAVVAYASVAFDVDQLLQQRFPLAFGRSPRSLQVRQQIWDSGFEQFRKHPFGIGPASFFGQVQSTVGVKESIEMHSDYVATLVERGVVGFVGLLLLFVFLGRFLYQIVRDVRRLRRQDLILWTSALCGIVVGYFSYSLTHEALHHDSLWLILALVIAQWQILRQKVAQERQRLRPPTALRVPLPVG